MPHSASSAARRCWSQLPLRMVRLGRGDRRARPELQPHSNPQMPWGANSTKAMKTSRRTAPTPRCRTRAGARGAGRRPRQESVRSASRAADDHHDQHLTREQPEQQLRIGEARERRIERAGQAAERVGDGDHCDLVEAGVVAERQVLASFSRMPRSTAPKGEATSSGTARTIRSGRPGQNSRSPSWW